MSEFVASKALFVFTATVLAVSLLVNDRVRSKMSSPGNDVDDAVSEPRSRRFWPSVTPPNSRHEPPVACAPDCVVAKVMYLPL